MAKAQTGRAKSGGGLTSNKLVRPGVRVAPKTTNVINPAQTDYLGQATAFGKGPFVERAAKEVVKMGNTKALDVGKGGPGTGRVVHKSGSQSCHGPVTGTVRYGADILKDYGPEKSRG